MSSAGSDPKCMCRRCALKLLQKRQTGCQFPSSLLLSSRVQFNTGNFVLGFASAAVAVGLSFKAFVLSVPISV